METIEKALRQWWHDATGIVVCATASIDYDYCPHTMFFLALMSSYVNTHAADLKAYCISLYAFLSQLILKKLE